MGALQNIRTSYVGSYYYEIPIVRVHFSNKKYHITGCYGPTDLPITLLTYSRTISTYWALWAG
jgi:hypothetical protein